MVVLAGGAGRRLGGASKPDVVARGARLLDHVLHGLERLRRGGTGLGAVCVVAPEPVALPAGVLRALEDPPLGGPVAGIAAGLERLRLTGPPRADEPGQKDLEPPARTHGPARTGGVPRARPGAARHVEVPAAGQPTGPAPLTAVLTCDAPQSWQALPELLRAYAAGAASPGSPGSPGSTDGTAPGGRAGGADEPERPRAPTEGVCALQGSHLQYLLGVYRTSALGRAVAPGGVVLRDTAVRRALGGLDVVAVPLRQHPEAVHDLDTWEDVRAWDR